MMTHRLGRTQRDRGSDPDAYWQEVNARAARESEAPERPVVRPLVLRVPYWSEFGEDEYRVPLERRCPSCAGAREVGEFADCGVCGGRGLVLNANGQAVLELLARYRSEERSAGLPR